MRYKSGTMLDRREIPVDQTGIRTGIIETLKNYHYREFDCFPDRYFKMGKGIYTSSSIHICDISTINVSYLFDIENNNVRLTFSTGNYDEVMIGVVIDIVTRKDPISLSFSLSDVLKDYLDDEIPSSPKVKELIVRTTAPLDPVLLEARLDIAIDTILYMDALYQSIFYGVDMDL